MPKSDINNTTSTEMRKSCVVMVTYNKVPDLSKILKAITKNEIDALFICDNSNRKDVLNGIESQLSVARPGSVRLIRNGTNVGISKALNTAFRIALREGFYYIHLLDDDAIISDDLFRLERRCHEDLERHGNIIGVVCPVVSNDFRQLNSQLKRLPDVSVVKLFITSGALISTGLISEMGGYDESYFLEFADIEFSHRLSKLGYTIFRLNTILVTQDFGNAVNKRGLIAKLYQLYWSTSNSILVLKFNYGNDIQPNATYYAPERERIINSLNFTLRKLRRKDDTYVRSNFIRYAMFYFMGWMNSVIRELFLFMIFREPKYLKAIVF